MLRLLAVSTTMLVACAALPAVAWSEPKLEQVAAFDNTKKVLSSVLRGVNTALAAVGIESLTIQSIGGAPNVDPLGDTYVSVTPFARNEPYRHSSQFRARFNQCPIHEPTGAAA